MFVICEGDGIKIGKKTRSHGMRRAKPVARKKNIYKNTITMLGGHCSGSLPLAIRVRVKRTGEK